MAFAQRPTSRAGRLAAFDRFVLKHQSMVYNAAYRMLGDQGLATNVTQETFSRSFPIFTDLGPSAGHWLARIVANLCHAQQCSPPDDGRSAQAGYDSAQTFLNALPQEQRITVVLADVLGLSYREIAEATGVSTDVVKARLSQGRSRLRDTLLAEEVTLLKTPALADLPLPDPVG